MDKDRDKYIKQLLKELDELLNTHPELRPLQEKIDKIKEEVGPDPMARAQAINKMLIDHLNNNLIPALQALQAMSNGAKQIRMILIKKRENSSSDDTDSDNEILKKLLSGNLKKIIH